jgi:hypothetical protein
MHMKDCRGDTLDNSQTTTPLIFKITNVPLPAIAKIATELRLVWVALLAS